MKARHPPHFAILATMAFAASATFLCVFRGGWGISLGLHKTRADDPLIIGSYNTLLELAAVDLSESMTNRDLAELLSGNVSNLKFPMSQWFTHIGRKFTSSDIEAFMVNARRDLVKWSNKRRLKLNPNVPTDPIPTPLLLESVNDSVDQKSYSSCAVVGNSGAMLHSKHGRLIDGHEAVIRVNNARVEGFERHVGSKTTFSFVNSNEWVSCSRMWSCECNPYSRPVTMIIYVCQPIHFLDITLCNSSSLLVTDPRFDSQCASIAKYYSLKRFFAQGRRTIDEWKSAHDGNYFHYSSGMQAVMLALRICGRVSIFGFGKGNSSKHHYHTEQKAELGLHDYYAEYDLYRDFILRPKTVPFLDKDFRFPRMAWYR